jgi:2'-5' RNA ligase
MQITSHFIGVRLDEKIFLNLFGALKSYLIENKIENAVEILNSSTPHITLYYFGKELDAETQVKINNDLEELNKNRFPINIDKLGFFEKEGQKSLGYLYPSKNKNLEKINSKLKNNYVSEVPDNDYPVYISHLTLFKIKDFATYSKYETAIESVINKELKKIKSTDVFVEFSLYEVEENLATKVF